MRPVIWMHDKVAAIYSDELRGEGRMTRAESAAFDAGRRYGLALRRARSRARAQRCERARELANTLLIFGPYAGAVLAPSQPEHENSPNALIIRGARGGAGQHPQSVSDAGVTACSPPFNESAPPVA